MSGQAKRNRGLLDAVERAAHEAADLCETEVLKAGAALGEILQQAQAQAADLRLLQQRLDGAKLVCVVAVQGEVHRTWNEASPRVLGGLSTLVSDSTRSCRKLANACSDLGHVSDGSRVLALHTRIEAARLGDGRFQASSTATQLATLTAEVESVTLDVSKLVAEVLSLLPRLEDAGRAVGASAHSFGRRLAAKMRSVEDSDEALRNALAQLVTDAEEELSAIIFASRHAVSGLQFQDPVSQALRRAAAQVNRALEGDLDIALAQVVRAQQESRRAGVEGLTAASASLDDVGRRTERSATLCRDRLAGVLEQEGHLLASAVANVRDELDAFIAAIEARGGEQAELTDQAVACCERIGQAEVAIRTVSNRSRILSANAAIRAYRAGAEGRSVSAIAVEMRRVDARVVAVTDVLDTETRSLLAMLPQFRHVSEMLQQVTTEGARRILMSVGEAQTGTDALKGDVQCVLDSAADRLFKTVEASARARRHLGFRDELLEILDDLEHMTMALGGDADLATPVPTDEGGPAAGELLLF